MSTEKINNNVLQVNSYEEWFNKFNSIINNSDYMIKTPDIKLLKILYNDNFIPCEAVNYLINLRGNNNSDDYKLWKENITKLVKKKINLECDDIDDFPYMKNYKKGKTSKEVSENIININFQK